MAIKLALPVNGPITQLFGENPDVYKKWGFPGHNGIDYGSGKRLHSKSVWIEYEKGKWVALAFNGIVNLKVK